MFTSRSKWDEKFAEKEEYRFERGWMTVVVSGVASCVANAERLPSPRGAKEKEEKEEEEEEEEEEEVEREEEERRGRGIGASSNLFSVPEDACGCGIYTSKAAKGDIMAWPDFTRCRPRRGERTSNKKGEGTRGDAEVALAWKSRRVDPVTRLCTRRPRLTVPGRGGLISRPYRIRHDNRPNIHTNAVPCRAALHRIAPHRATPHRTAPHRTVVPGDPSRRDEESKPPPPLLLRSYRQSISSESSNVKRHEGEEEAEDEAEDEAEEEEEEKKEEEEEEEEEEERRLPKSLKSLKMKRQRFRLLFSSPSEAGLGPGRRYNLRRFQGGPGLRDPGPRSLGQQPSSMKSSASPARGGLLLYRGTAPPRRSEEGRGDGGGGGRFEQVLRNSRLMRRPGVRVKRIMAFNEEESR
uniref:Uncharacterized protein n=1 Tax=Vespula pensylvanica TaxID=30213 RepID=A0A834P1D9_VESPE|nr:hypothetical protein H0235_007529 [Vespula pensylvanica]